MHRYVAIYVTEFDKKDFHAHTFNFTNLKDHNSL